jgi:hypothetical protein
MTDLEFTAELARAVDAIGLEALAARLDVPATLVQVWMNGYTLIPVRKAVLLIDLLLDIAPSEPLN